MKALDILVRITRTPQDLFRYSDKELYEAIAEIEALQQPKSCEGCKYDFIPNFILNNVGDKIDICYMCSRQERLDRYETKEQ